MDQKIKTYFDKGVNLYQLGRYEESLTAFEKAIAIDPNYARPWYGKGKAYEELNRCEDAIAAYEKAIKLDPELAKPWYGKGNVFYKLGRYEEAIATFEIAIVLEPKSSFPWCGKGNALYVLGRYKESLTAYENAIALDPKGASPWIGKGLALYGLGRYKESLTACENAIALDPKEASPWIYKGNALYGLGRYKESLTAYENAIALNPIDASSWICKGNALYGLGRYKESLTAFDDAIALDSKDALPWNGKGNVFLMLEKYEESLTTYEKAIALDPKYAAPWNGKGTALRKLGRLEEALTVCEKGIALNPKSVFVWVGKGLVLNELGRFEEALTAYDKAISLCPKDVMSWICKATTYDKVSDELQAYTCLVRAYYLSDSSTFIENYKVLRPLIKKYFSTFFMHRICSDHPVLMTSLDWYRLSAIVIENIVDLLQYIRFVRKHKGFKNEIERKKILGITYFYLGDPLEAHRIFDDIDSLDDEDLMGQYYLFACLNAFEEPSDDELEFALKQATKVFNGNTKNDSEQLYYAGLLFCIDSRYENAIAIFQRIFKKDMDFLAAQYMLMFSHHRAKNFKQRNKLINLILKKERLLHAEGKHGFISGVTLESFDLASPNWGRPFLKYARWVEISEAIQLIHELIERHELKHGDLPSKIRFIDSSKYSPDNLLQAWIQNEKFANEIEKTKIEMGRDDLEVMRAELRLIFPYFPFATDPREEKDLELVIARIIDEEKKPLKERAPDYHKLITYCYCQDNISDHGYIFLTFYLFHQIYKQGQKKRKGFVEELTKASFFTIVSSCLFSKAGLLIPSVGYVAVYVCFSFFFSQLKELAIDMVDLDELSYVDFKAHFNEFFVKLVKKERDFPEVVRDLWQYFD